MIDLKKNEIKLVEFVKGKYDGASATIMNPSNILKIAEREKGKNKVYHYIFKEMRNDRLIYEFVEEEIESEST